MTWYVSWQSGLEIAYAETEHKHDADAIGTALEATGHTNVWIYPATTTSRHSAPRVDEPLIGNAALRIRDALRQNEARRQS